MTSHSLLHEYIRARDIARVFSNCELEIPADLAKAIAEYDRQLAIYLEDQRLKRFARRVSGGLNA